jgi:hypothetical protein
LITLQRDLLIDLLRIGVEAEQPAKASSLKGGLVFISTSLAAWPCGCIPTKILAWPAQAQLTRLGQRESSRMV